MPRKRIVIVAAMRRELAPLLRDVKAIRNDRVEFFELEAAAVAIGGIGRVAARRTAEAAIVKYAPGLIVSAGVAGALVAKLKVGDVLQANEVVDADSGKRFEHLGGQFVIATVSSVSGPAEKISLAERWRAEVVDMEAASVAGVAQTRGIEFAAVKAISDELEFAMPPVAGFVDDAGRFQTLRFATYIAVRPEWWKAVRQLNANSRLAAVNLSEALKHLISARSLISQEEKIARA